MSNIQTLSLNVIKQLAEKELSDVNETPFVNIIALNTFNDDEEPELNHLYVHAVIEDAGDADCDGRHPWVLDWDPEEDEFVTIMRLDQEVDDEDEEEGN